MGVKEISPNLEDAILERYCIKQNLLKENVRRAGIVDSILSRFARSFYKPNPVRRAINFFRRIFHEGGYGRAYTAEELSSELATRGLSREFLQDLISTNFPPNSFLIEDPICFVPTKYEDGRTTYRLYIPSGEVDEDD